MRVSRHKDHIPKYTHWRTCPWFNGYCRKKWTKPPGFKSWTKLIAFHITLIPLEKVWIQLFALQWWVTSRTDWVHQPCLGNLFRRRKPVKLHLNFGLVSHPAHAVGLVNTYRPTHTNRHTHIRMSIMVY